MSPRSPRLDAGPSPGRMSNGDPPPRLFDGDSVLTRVFRTDRRLLSSDGATSVLPIFLAAAAAAAAALLAAALPAAAAAVATCTTAVLPSPCATATCGGLSDAGPATVLPVRT